MVTISNGIMTAKINELGAELSSFASSEREYIWQGDPAIWKKHSPVLFPFVGRLPEGMYYYKDKKYGPVACHGFAPVSTFIVESWEESSCTLLLVQDKSVMDLYPFKFDFRVRYELTDKTLTVKYLVTNRGEEDMYYGLGSHPGVNVPIKDGIPFEDYFIEFPDASDVKRRIFTPGVLDTGVSEPYSLDNKRLHLRHNLFDFDAVCLENTGYVAVLKTDRDSACVTVRYPETRWCAFWHKTGAKAPYVCFEPWFTLPGHEGKNDIATREDSLHLCPGKSAQHIMSITVSD